MSIICTKKHLVSIVFLLLLLGTSQQTTAQMNGKEIGIDPGHGGIDPGAVGWDGPGYPNEKDFNLLVALKYRTKLQNAGATVRMTRTTDVWMSLDARVAYMNNYPLDHYISVHCNSFTDPSANGTETYWHTYGFSTDQQLATKIQNNLINYLGRANRGVKQASFTVLTANHPAALTELLFISNQSEFHIINDNTGQENAANGLYYGSLDFAGATSGFASVSQGVAVTPSPILYGNYFTTSFTLREIQGSSITLERVVCAILNNDNTHLRDMDIKGPITILANDIYNYSSTQLWRITDPAGNYKAVARGKVTGGNWFDFTTTGIGVNPRVFQVQQQIKPTLISPSNGSNQTCGITFQWNIVSGATNYRLYLLLPGSSSWLSDETASTSYSYPPMEIGQYRWKVKAYVNGIWSDYSDEWTFYFDGVDAPTLIYPANYSAISEVRPTFQWSSVSCANYYELQLARNTSFSDKIRDKLNIYGESWQLDNQDLVPGQTYYWRVRSNNPIGQWSDIWSFSIFSSQATLTVSGNPDEHDAPDPSYGQHSYDIGTNINATVTSPADPTSNTRYRCDGYTGTGSVPFSGSNLNVSFTIDQNSTLTWNWITQYKLDVSSAGNGTVTPNGIDWLDEGTGQILSANPDPGFVVDYWSVNGMNMWHGEDVVGIGMVEPKEIIVHFKQILGNQFPSISITDPSNNDFFNHPNISVIGNADDPDGTVVEVYVKLNDGIYELANGTENWAIDIQLGLGINHIFAKAKDNDGDWSNVDQIQVTYTEPMVNQPPTINITNPEDGDFTTNPEITVTGTADDPDGTVFQVQVKLNEGTYKIASGTNNWSKDITLESGINIIYARAKDNEGHYSTIQTIQVTYGDQPIIVTYPNEEKICWVKGESYEITWTSSGIVDPFVLIQLIKGESYVCTIGGGTTENDGLEVWTVPTGLPNGLDYLIKICSHPNLDLYDTSDHYFEIDTECSILNVDIVPKNSVSSMNNFPNPFNSTTKIILLFSNPTYTVLKIFNPNGKEIETLVNQKLAPGEHEIIWAPNDLPSGIYLCQIRADEFLETKKLILQR